jgi:hypothetical protein
MISLSAEAKRYWDEYLFGLKWIGPLFTASEDSEYVTVELEFHWLPQRMPQLLRGSGLFVEKKDRPQWSSSINLLSESKMESLIDLLTEVEATDVTSPAQWNDETPPQLLDCDGAAIESGRVLLLRCSREDVDKVEALIKTRWMLTRMAVFSGALSEPEGLRVCPTWYRMRNDLLGLGRRD